MFYVGNILWMESGETTQDIPNFRHNFSGCVRWTWGSLEWFKNGFQQSLQDPVTGEWMPAVVWEDGKKAWYDHGAAHSFQNPTTGEWMPAVIDSDGRKYWYYHGREIINPNKNNKKV